MMPMVSAICCTSERMWLETHHCRARRREAADLVVQLLNADRVEAVGGLVEHKQAWPSR